MNKSVEQNDSISLNNDEIAIVFTPESVRVVTPPVDDDDIAHPHQHFAVMLAYLASTDEEWVESVLKRFDEVTGDK